MTSRWHHLAAGALVGALLFGQTARSAQEANRAECGLKAASLCKLFNFVHWPDNAREAHDVFVLGILGDNHFADTLEGIIGNQTIQGRRLILRRGRDISDFKTSHMLFISQTEKGRLPQIIESLKGASVLTVGESEHFCELGGMINLKRLGNEVQFEINLRAAERANLKISSQLLKLSIVTKQARREEGN